jgi:glycosyltransferase involved in cell wall biosynthesis
MNNLISIYLPSVNGGGAERVMVTLANGFVGRGLNVDLVLAKAEGPYLQEVDSKVRIIDLDASRVAFSLPGLVNYLRRERPIAMLSAMNHVNVIAIIARKLSGISTRLVVSERNAMMAPGMPPAKGIARIMPLFMRWSYPKADAVHAVSSGSADLLAESIGIDRKNIFVVYNPVDHNYIRNLSTEPLDHPWFANNQLPVVPVPVILAAGRLTTQKNFSGLIQAFKKVHEKVPSRLIILGEGELRGELELMVDKLGLKSDVYLPGFVDNPFKWMRNASLFVLSSCWEGLPNVLIQAMVCGTPVVSTDCPTGPAEILENGKWGRLVQVGDNELLVDAIVGALNDVNSPDVVSRSNKFSIDNAVDGYLQLLLPNSNAGYKLGKD